MGGKYKVTPRLNPSILNEIPGFIFGEIVWFVQYYETYAFIGSLTEKQF